MKLHILFLVIIISVFQINAQNMIEIPAILSDNMVLQQNSEVTFWGKAAPETKIKIKTGWGNSNTCITQNDGLWNLVVSTPKAGGPYEIEMQIGNSKKTIKNILVGEVWICSGQSNMEMPLEGWPPIDTIMNSASEIQNANYPNIRLFTVQRKFSGSPEFNCIGEWKECSPETAAKFSATGYFFGKKLYNELNIPIGLIHTSWGGTPVEAWTGAKYLSTYENYKNQIDNMSKAKEEVQKLYEWRNNFPQMDISKKPLDEKWLNLNFGDSDCSTPEYNDNDWSEMNLPTLWESTELGNFDGAVWFRKKIEIPETWLNKDLKISLGPIDDIDITYVNGKKIGSNEVDGVWQIERIYNIPKEIVNSITLTIAIRVLDPQGGGGIYGAKEKMTLSNADEKPISISGSWKYLPVAEYEASKFYVFGANNAFLSRPKVSVNLGQNTPTMLYNGMIAPIINFKIKGAIWYQGESNVYNANMYNELFSLMIKNWRDNWKQPDLPFYFTQIAPYNYGDNSKSEFLREAQFKSLSVPNTGMAVTLDIGNVNNIHPANKHDVGSRLALWALAKDYGKNIVFSGPLYKKIESNVEEIKLYFDYAESGLEIKGEAKNFLIAGQDKIFKEAKVKINGTTLSVYHPEIKNPKAVRYAFTNTSEATLFNKEGLPASSFRTDNWKE